MAEREFVLLMRGDTADRTLRVLPVAEGSSSPMGKGITVEPVELQRRRYLLMLQGGDAPEQSSVRHNGQPAWPVTLLRVKDEVRTAAGSFFVSSQRSQSVFSPEQRHLGVQCPLCTLRVEKDTLLFACGCGALLHCEDERWPEAERLECAKLAPACPNCQQAIDFQIGIEWEPAL